MIDVRTSGDSDTKNLSDIFYSAENIAELERRVADIRSGKSTLKEHTLIEVDE